MEEGDSRRMICAVSTASNLKGINELELKIQGEVVKIHLDDDSYWEIDSFLKRYE